MVRTHDRFICLFILRRTLYKRLQICSKYYSGFRGWCIGKEADDRCRGLFKALCQYTIRCESSSEIDISQIQSGFADHPVAIFDGILAWRRMPRPVALSDRRQNSEMRETWNRTVRLYLISLAGTETPLRLFWSPFTDEIQCVIEAFIKHRNWKLYQLF